MRKWVLMASIALVCLLGNSAYADEQWWKKWNPYPEVPKITAKEVKRLMTSGEKVVFIYADGEGSITIPSGNPCAGTTLGLNKTASIARVEHADADGTARFFSSVPADACGRVYMQALDIELCQTTNVVIVN